jgi:hypothetical protein
LAESQQLVTREREGISGYLFRGEKALIGDIHLPTPKYKLDGCLMA